MSVETQIARIRGNIASAYAQAAQKEAAMADVLNIACGQLGVTASPAGSNRTKYGKWMGLDGQPC